jgi:serine/threonine-protein kinase
MDVGSEFSNYRVIEHIGRGGMADVWSARDKRLARTVAVKTIAGDLSNDMNPIQLFEREAQTIAALEHPHILPIYEFGEFDNQLYIVMRYVSGGSLEDLLEKGPLSVEETLRVVRAVGQALDYAHQSKVIHLDLKPSNILLDSYQSPYLADFGLATMLGPEGRAQNPGSGTLLYMAPEQLTADMLDSRADIYSFAILVFHMLTGQLPFDGAIPLAIRQLQSGDSMPDVTQLRPGLPELVNVVLQHASMLDIGSRAESLKDVMNQLEQVLGGGRRLVLSSDTRGMPSNNPETRGISTLPLDQLISGPLDGLVSRPISPSTSPVKPDDMDALITGPIDGLVSRPLSPSTLPVKPDDLDALITGPIDGLVKKTSEIPSASDLDSLITGPIDGLVKKTSEIPSASELDSLITGPIDGLVKKTGELPAVSRESIALEKLISGPIGNLISKIGQAHIEPTAPPAPVTFEDEAVREAYDIYVRARRAFAGGQGKFILGVTDFILIADTYAEADRHHLELDESGLGMLLRGALEYDYQLAAWWGRADDEGRRWVSLHALRSENAPARQRAIERLTHLPDTESPQIPRLVGQALNVETNRPALVAGLHLLGARSPLPQRVRAWWETLGLATARDWRPLAYSREIDHLLARKALDHDEPEAAALAARIIGRVRSEAAAQALSEARAAGHKGALSALAIARDEANSLPASISGGERFISWLANTSRRWRENPMGYVWRFVAALLFSIAGMGLFLYLSLSAFSQVLFAQVYGRTVSVGLMFGTLLALSVLVADEMPQRLRGFWTWWLRAIWAFAFGLVLVTATWGAYNYLILEINDLAWNVLALGGLGAAVAFALMNIVRLPGIARTAITFVGLYLPIVLTFQNAWNSSYAEPAIMYFTDLDTLVQWGVPMFILIAIGVNFHALLRDIRWVIGRLKRG